MNLLHELPSTLIYITHAEDGTKPTKMMERRVGEEGDDGGCAVDLASKMQNLLIIEQLANRVFLCHSLSEVVNFFFS